MYKKAIIMVFTISLPLLLSSFVVQAAEEQDQYLRHRFNSGDVKPDHMAFSSRISTLAHFSEIDQRDFAITDIQQNMRVTESRANELLDYFIDAWKQVKAETLKPL